MKVALIGSGNIGQTLGGSFVKAGQSGVKYETEGTGFGFKTEVKVDADRNVPRMVCHMERPTR